MNSRSSNPDKRQGAARLEKGDCVLNGYGQPVGLPLPGWTPPPIPPRGSMEGRFCRIEPLHLESHAGDLYSAYNGKEGASLWTYLPYGPFDDFSGYLSWIQRACQMEDTLFFAIIHRESGKAVGVASYLRIDPLVGSIEVGHLAFAPFLQRTPAATEAMYLMMQRAFSLGYRRYEWKCDALNAPSRSAAQRLGMRFEGVFRQASVYKGRNRDTAWYSVIDREWPPLEAAFLQWLAPENFDEMGRQRLRLSELTGRLTKE